MLEAIDLARPPMLAALSLQLAAGTVTGIVGRNGAGKTTLLKALAGVSAGPGRTLLDGNALVPGPRALAWLPASRDVVWPMTAGTVVALGLGPGLAPLAAPDAAAVVAALAACGAGHLVARRVDRLSTGERARVLLARALVARPRWLILDEPIANLDPGQRLDVMALLRTQAARGAGVVLALHDLDLARQCDRLLVIDGGTLVADGPPDRVLVPALVSAVFGVVRGADGWQRA